MNVTPSALEFIFIQGDLRFQQALTKTETFHEKCCTMVPSSTRENHYGWIGRLPAVREWLGERVVNNVAAREYTLKNKLFEDTLALDRIDIEDDQLGVFNMSLDMLGMQTKLWPDRLVTSLLQGGEDAGSVCYDGQPFFSASHPVNVDNSGAGTFSNYSSSGLALTAANFQTARATMQGYKGEDGSPLGVYPNVLMVPPALEATARQILNAEFIAPAAAFGQNTTAVQTNVLKGSADLVVNPWLAGEDTTWYLFDTRFPIRPFVFQTREAPVFTYKTSPSDESVFRLNKYLYGVHMRGNAGYTLPFLCYKGVA